MSFKDKQTIGSIQAKLDEFEDNLKYEWEHLGLDQAIKNSIEDHQTEIAYHLDQVKHHLKRVAHYKKRLDDIESIHQNTATDEKLPLKLRRVAKTSSLKYLLQWENILEEQKSDNVLNGVKFRDRRSVDGEFPMTHAMVKNRVEEFEAIRKPKRISSTMDTFLDFSGGKPRRIKSYPIIEDAEGEMELAPTSEGDKSRTMEETKSGEEILKEDHENGDCTPCSETSSKPRVVQIHYKQRRPGEEECLSNSL